MTATKTSSTVPGEFSTDQESFWAGDFGRNYIDRNDDEVLVRANAALFSKIFAATGPVSRILELGANVGCNLRAIRRVDPSAQLAAVEINPDAAGQVRAIGGIEVMQQSLLDPIDCKADFVFTKGVLIHINPDHLSTAYDQLYQSSNRWVMVAEYYNPTPVAIPYRGHDDRLFKRDFAGEMLSRFTDLRLVDYGFVYHRDHFPQDDLTWFLMEKTGGRSDETR